MTPKNPMRPPGALIVDAGDLIDYPGALWRIHRTTGPYRQTWDEMRTYGPLASMRWDAHPPPPGEHPAAAVSYTATDVVTTFAEAFQARRSITLSGAVALAGWEPTRPLKLLDLTGTWLVRNGASASLAGTRKDTCRGWARAVRQAWPDIDGLYAPSTMTGGPMAVLYAPSSNSFPAAPRLARALNHPGLSGVVVKVADELGWPVRTV